MKIKISTASPDALNRDTLILGFFSDERPPRGYCGLVDWRLNGMISTEIARGRISGDFLEKLLYAFPKRIRISRILLFGLGALSELTYDRLYNAGYEMARTVSGIRADDLALPIPAADRGLETLRDGRSPDHGPFRRFFMQTGGTSLPPSGDSGKGGSRG